MRTLKLLLAFFIVVGTTPTAMAHDDRDDRDTFRARLSGYNEVQFVTTVTGGVVTAAALRGGVSTGASGTFRATIHDSSQSIDYTLIYQGLEGNVTQAHIHFGQPRTVGGIVVWLCQTAAVPAPPAVAAATPTCPGPHDGTVVGTILPAQVLAATGQGISAGEFGELVRAIRAGVTYANVHSAGAGNPAVPTDFNSGEIRGPIGRGDD